MPLAEAALSVLAGWLWGKLEDYAYSKDQINEVKGALERSIGRGYEKFSRLQPELSESFFDEHFLEYGVGQEFEKLLTRGDSPNIPKIAKAYYKQFSLPVDEEVESKIQMFFELVETEMGLEPVLREAIDSRKLETISKTTDATFRAVKEHTKDDLETKELLKKLLETQLGQDAAVNELKAGISDISRAFSVSNSVPVEKGEALVNKLISKQIEKAKNLLSDGKINSARTYLYEIEDDVNETDDYCRFRWHSCIAACDLMEGNYKEAAEGYIVAYRFAPGDEKAWANKARAYLILNDAKSALEVSAEGIKEYPDSALIWAIRINSRQILEYEDIDSDLPNSIIDDPDILFSRSFSMARQGDFGGAFACLKQVYNAEKTGLEVRQALLQNALEYSLGKSLPPLLCQLDSGQKEALNYSLQIIEPVENLLENADRSPTLDALINNAAVAYEITGQLRRAQHLADLAIAKGIFSDGIFRIKLDSLIARDDLSGVEGICEDNLKEFSNQRLLYLLEATSLLKSENFSNDIISELDNRPLEDDEERDYSTLKLLVEWRCFGTAKAYDLGENLLRDEPNNPLLNILFTRIAAASNRNIENLIGRCIELCEGTSENVKLQVAELLFDVEYFFEASTLYKEIIEYPSADPVGLRYLVSLVNSDQRALAKRFLEDLPEEERKKDQVVRIEANLCRAVGDMDRLSSILTKAVSDDPQDSYFAICLAGCLFLKNELDSLKKLLISDPKFVNAPPEHEFEFAKYQAIHGVSILALGRMYRLLKLKPNDSDIAGFYLITLLLAEDLTDELAVSCAGEGVASLIKVGENTKWVVIDAPEFGPENQWPEMQNSQSLVAEQIKSKKVGDAFTFDNGFIENEAEIVSNEHIFLYAARKARGVIESSAFNSGPLWSFKILKDDGELDLAPIEKAVASRKRQVKLVFEHYRTRTIPVASVASAIGTDPITLSLEWPFKEVRKIVSNGMHETRKAQIQTLVAGQSRYVIELQALVEISIWDLWSKISDITGKPLVASSLVELLVSIVESQKENVEKASGVMQEMDGQLRITEISPEMSKKRFDFLRGLLDSVRYYCEVVPAFGPEKPIKELSILRKVMDNATVDTILLALEKEAVLLSGDEHLKVLAEHSGVGPSVDFQNLLMVLVEKRLITKQKYSEIVLDKIYRGHSFVSVDADDLDWGAKRNLGKIPTEMREVFESFKSENLEINSAVRVCLNFLNKILDSHPAHLIADYYRLCLESLCAKREELSDVIYESFRRNFESAIRRLNARERRNLRRMLGSFLVPIPLPPPKDTDNLRVNRLAKAIRSILNNY
ncbi:MAG TPA: hypothetical protein VFN01_09035 [Marinobacter sp.]|uniref:tetratricopeptide repeat protein n=1 Tax=Marinobacter sp. TaxID=50741 RepID=UPI002D7FFE51|nr:hypothetical protein [Marinobacter sp.]HET8801315.1 hypothetical protein [Marinobacter sp.]